MTEREKISSIIAPYVSAFGEDAAIADALIAANIGDVTEWKHRAEVAERALLNVAYKIVIYIGSTYTSDFSSIEVGHAKNYIELEIAAENVKNVELKQAEKELAEEG